MSTPRSKQAENNKLFNVTINIKESVYTAWW